MKSPCFQTLFGSFLVVTAGYAASTPSGFGPVMAEGLFTDVPSPLSSTLKTRLAKRVRYVKINDESFTRLPSTLKPGGLTNFQLNLFSDTKYTFVLEKPKFLSDGVILTGHLLEAPGSSALLTFEDGVLAGDFFVPGKGKFQIRYAGNGTHKILEIDPTQGPADSDVLLKIPPQETPVANLPPSSDPVWYPNCTYDINNNYIIDLLVAYTPSALAEAGGTTTAMQTTINQAVAYTNQCFVNSSINAEIRLVHVEEVAYTESGNMATDLYRLQNPADGYMDNVPVDRNTYGADLVSLFVGSADSNFGGEAFFACTNTGTYPDLGYSILWDYEALPHEIGHNLGCAHDQAHTSGPGVFPYSYGWYFTANGTIYGDVMSYVGLNTSNYSNPNVNFQGVPTGSINANNALSINNTAITVAGFRQTAGANVYPDVTITSPPNGYVEIQPNPVTIMTNPSSSAGTITQVDFYSDNNYLGTVTNSPYNFSIILSAGSHLLTAWATNSLGSFRISCPVSVLVQSNLPSPWQETAVGTTAVPGYTTYNSSSFTLNGVGNGNGIYGAWDNSFYFVYQPLCGDGSIIARFVNGSTNGIPTSGIMMRDNFNFYTDFIAIQCLPFNTPSLEIDFMDQYPSTMLPGYISNCSSLGYAPTPSWLKIQRTGNVFNLFTSPDGSAWTSSCSGSVTIPMGQTIYAGIYAANRNPPIITNSTFDNVSMSMSCLPPTTTNTPVLTFTPTLTLTRTYTPTGSPTYTPSPTFTPTNTIVETLQIDTFPTYTPTPSNTPTNTSTNTPSNTPTETPTDTPTPTPTDSPTNTPTDSPCMVGGTPCTNTVTTTFTFTLTPTNTSTLTPTFTPTYTPSVTLTPTVTPTATLNPSKLIYNDVPYPNPVKETNQITFSYQLSIQADKVSFKLFTTAFRKVAAFDGTTNSGPNTVSFDVSSFANGLYYYLIEADSSGKQEHKIGKLLIMR